MRIRSTGPDVKNIMAPFGTASAVQKYTHRQTLPWANGSTGNILGVPFTVGVELSQLGESGLVVSDSAFRLKVFNALMAKIPTVQRLAAPEVNFVISRVYEEIQDVVTPKFKARVSAGEIINNPMTQLYTSFISPPIVATSYKHNLSVGDDLWATWRADRWSTDCFITITVEPVWTATSVAYSQTYHEEVVKQLSDVVSSQTDSALIGAFSKLQQAELDVAMMVAEGGETLKYLRDLVMRAMKMLRAINDPKAVWRYAPKAFKSITEVGIYKALAAAYLEARYAIRPLLIDIDDTLKYLSGGKAGPRQNRYTYRKREAASQGGYKYVMVGSQRIRVDYSIERSARAGVLAQAGFEVPGSSFGFMNWASIAFEKVKYSFILAWLIDVGGFLYRLNPNVTFKPLATWVTDIISITYIATMEVSTPSGIQTLTSSGSYRMKSRKPVVDNLPPLATFAINLDGFKLLDLLAIAGQIKTR